MFSEKKNPSILIIGYSRTELIKRRIDEAILLSDLDIIVSIDGQEKLEEKIREEFRLLKKNYFHHERITFKQQNVNLGLSQHVVNAVSETLKNYEATIVLENDVVVSKHFFESMKLAITNIEGKEDYLCVCAYSGIGQPKYIKKQIPNFWRNSKYFCAWGWAITRKSWNEILQSGEISELKLSSIRNFSKILNNRKINIWRKRLKRDVWDYKMQVYLILSKKKILMPLIRITSNEGFEKELSTNTRHGIPRTIKYFNPSEFAPFKIVLKLDWFWNFLDSNLWAGDGLISTRARTIGVRTFIKKKINIRFWE